MILLLTPVIFRETVPLTYVPTLPMNPWGLSPPCHDPSITRGNNGFSYRRQWEKGGEWVLWFTNLLLVLLPPSFPSIMGIGRLGGHATYLSNLPSFTSAFSTSSSFSPFPFSSLPSIAFQPFITNYTSCHFLMLSSLPSPPTFSHFS